MNTVDEYILIYSNELRELQLKVNRKLGQGWQPCGGIAAYGLDNQNHYVQAMIKYAPPPVETNTH